MKTIYEYIGLRKFHVSFVSTVVIHLWLPDDTPFPPLCCCRPPPPPKFLLPPPPGAAGPPSPGDATATMGETGGGTLAS